MIGLESQWQLNAARLIFHERFAATLPIQTCYRRYRARRLLVDTVSKQPYLNPLFSDTYLAAHRASVKFSLPRSIRDLKRVSWLSSVKIQTLWRRHVQYVKYHTWIMRVRTVQSFARMTPAKLKYQRDRLMIIRLQAWGRCRVARRRFLELKYAALMVQKHLRRYFGSILIGEMREQHWSLLERRLGGALVIQTAVRRYLAASRVAALKDLDTRRESAALLLQKCWYQRNGFFHTFLLMGCYRELAIENKAADNEVARSERHYCARKIQRVFRQRRLERRPYFAREIQRWYRGRRDYCYTVALRRRTYASRKLHHWGRARLNRRHAMARRIQRLWWSCLSGRLLRHLQYKAHMMDLLEDRLSAEERYVAATRLQAVVRRRQGRRSFTRYLLARRIQRRYRRFAREKALRLFKVAVAVRYAAPCVEVMIGAAVDRVRRALVARHDALLSLPQALVRGWMVRRAATKLRMTLKRYHDSAMTIQRFWRGESLRSLRLGCMCYSYRSKCSLCACMALARAFAQLSLTESTHLRMKIFTEKRAMLAAMGGREDNPYRQCFAIDQLVRLVNRDTRRHLSVVDPRCGMSLSTLLARLSMSEYLEMFPKNKYGLAADLRKLTLAGLCGLYEDRQRKLQKDSIARGTNTEATAKKAPPVPTADMEAILCVARPRMYPCSSSQRRRVAALAPLLDADSYGNSLLSLQSEFQKHSGNRAKAHNLAAVVMGELCKSYSNYMGLGDTLTRGVVARALKTNKSSAIKTDLLSRISSQYGSAEEVKRNKSRCKSCLKTLEYGMMQALLILEDGLLLRLIFNASTSAFRFKRRFRYLYLSKRDLATSSVSSLNSVANASTLKRTVVLGGLAIPNIPPLHEAIQMGIVQTADRQFVGTIEYREIEYALNQSRIYLSVLELLYLADCGLRVLQCRYRYCVYKALVRRAKLQLFLNSEQVLYSFGRRKDRVRQTWAMFRRVEAVAVDMQAILLDKLHKRYDVVNRLERIARHGWESAYDEASGAQYWWSSKGDPSTYEMPRYSLLEWRAAWSIERCYRMHLQCVVLKRERARIEEERRIDMEQRKLTQHTFSLVTLSLKTDSGKSVLSTAAALQFPFRLQFDDDLIIRPRMWLLLADSAGESYRAVFVLKVSTRKGVPYTCQVRTVDDEIVSDVPVDRIFKLRLEIGSVVEARYKGLTLFYRGRATCCRRSSTGLELLNILYEDGEFERDVGIDLVRIPQSEIDALIGARNAFKILRSKQQKRSAHYASLMRSRGNACMDVTPVAAYTRKTTRFGWDLIREKGQAKYYNKRDDIKSSRPQEYSVQQSASVVLIQRLCRVFVAKRRLKALLAKFTIGFIASDAMEQSKRTAYIGYKLEGVTPMQMLRRAGCWELAEAIETFHKNKLIQFGNISVKSLITLPASKFSSVGISTIALEKAMKAFQEWWGKTAPEKRAKSLSFVNYFKTYADARSLRQCVTDSKPSLLKMFLGVFPNNTNRVSAAVTQLIASVFPLTNRQVHEFLKTYNGKPSVAQDRISELVNVPTLHMEEEESAAYSIYLIASKRVCTVLKTYKIACMLRAVSDAIKGAELIVSSASDRKHAKAALLLRIESIDYLLHCQTASTSLQRIVRGYTKRSQWIKICLKRIASALTIQCCVRRHFVMKLANVLRSQQQSIYEQLWDSNLQLVYFYNRSTSESSYVAPPEGVPYRPLVREYYSDALIQAWPQLDNPSRYLADDSAVDPSTCCVCRVRNSVRVCTDCTRVGKYGDVSYLSYCFPCFSSEHSSSKSDHRYTDSDQPAAEEYLKCCECDYPATRKCFGSISDSKVIEVCNALKRGQLSKWGEILRSLNVFNEQKLQLLMLSIGTRSGASMAVHLQEVQGLLERMQSECDECYCFDCYRDIHSGGKRKGHVWCGFKEYAAACPVCFRSPSKVRCFECDESYCSSCYKVLHGMGKKRRHKHMLLVEPNPFNVDLCSLCTQRVGTTFCPKKCGFIGCDSCVECVHQDSCSKKDAAPTRENACSLCGDSADTICLECGDLYCSKKWMGNPGCFAKNHSKGRRMLHNLAAHVIRA